MVKECNQSAVIGVGVDIIEIDRIQKAISRHKNFISKIFTDDEIEYFSKKNMKAETIAGYFTAKEAVGKALGCGIYKGRWKDIEIKKTELGNPLVELHGEIKEYANSKKYVNIAISISHCKTYAVSNAVVSR